MTTRVLFTSDPEGKNVFSTKTAFDKAAGDPDKMALLAAQLFTSCVVDNMHTLLNPFKKALLESLDENEAKTIWAIIAGSEDLMSLCLISAGFGLSISGRWEPHLAMSPGLKDGIGTFIPSDDYKEYERLTLAAAKGLIYNAALQIDETKKAFMKDEQFADFVENKAKELHEVANRAGINKNKSEMN